MKKRSGKLPLSSITMLLCSLLTVSLTACLDALDSDTPSPNMPVTYISIYHGAPDAPDFDIFVNNSRINNGGFKYTHFSNYFNFVAPGNHRIKFTPVNAANAFIDTALTFQADKIYSLFVVDQLQSMDLMVVQDSRITLGTAEAGLRVLQLSPDAPAVDVVAVKSGTSTSLTSSMDFKAITPFRKIASGTHTIQIKRAGSDEVMLSVPNVTLEPGRIYSFIIRGFATPPTGNLNVLSMQVIRNY